MKRMITFTVCLFSVGALLAIGGAFRTEYKHFLLSAKASSASEILPFKGRLLYSARTEQTFEGNSACNHDLFALTLPNAQKKRLTDHNRDSALNLGGCITDPLISPDGKRALFLSNCADDPELEVRMYTGRQPYPYRYLNLWMYDLEKGVVTPITKGFLGWREVQWSPEGAFFCGITPAREGAFQDDPPDKIVVFDAHTLKPQTIAQTQKGIISLRWGLDSRVLFYQTTPTRVEKVEIASRRTDRLLNSKEIIWDYAVSSRGEVAYIEGAKVYLSSIDHPGQRTLLFSDPNAPEKLMPWQNPPHPFTRLAWSNDARLLAIIEKKDLPGRDPLFNLHTLDPITRKSKTLAAFSNKGIADLSILSWSKDARWIFVKISCQGGFEGVSAVSVDDGRSFVLKAPDEGLQGIDWFEEVPL